MPSIQMILSWLVIFIAVPLNWLVVFGLWQLVRTHPSNRVLRDRFLVATFLAAIVTMFGSVFLNNDIVPPPFTPMQTMVVTRLSILSLTVPALYWLSLYRTRSP